MKLKAQTLTGLLETHFVISKLPCDQLMEVWYIYTMEYYSAIKRNEIGSFSRSIHISTNDPISSVIQNEVIQREKQVFYINTYMWNLEKWYR